VRTRGKRNAQGRPTQGSKTAPPIRGPEDDKETGSRLKPISGRLKAKKTKRGRQEKRDEGAVASALGKHHPRGKSSATSSTDASPSEDNQREAKKKGARRELKAVRTKKE